jgi:hypothetical protein
MSEESLAAIAPQITDWPKGLIFPLSANGPVPFEVKTLDGERYTLLIGGVGPEGGSSNKDYPALTFRHQRMLFSIMNGRRFVAREMPFRLSRVCRTDGTAQRELAKQLVSDLSKSYVHRIDGKIPRARAEPLLALKTRIYYAEGVDPTNPEQINKDENIVRIEYRSAVLNEDLWRAFIHFDQCWPVRTDVLANIYSDIAAACYLLLAPKAHAEGISARHAGRKDASELLREIGAKVPSQPSQLKRVFLRDRGRGNLLQQLQGLETKSGYLMVDDRLEETERGFNVRFWLVRDRQELLAATAPIFGKGACFDYWVEQGLPPEEFRAFRHRFPGQLESYEEENIARLGYPVEKNRAFLELIRGAIGPVEFGVMIGQAAIDLREGNAREGVEKFFGGMLRGAFQDAIREFKFGGRARRKIKA